MSPHSAPIKTVDGRSCEGCTLCCKLLSIAELAKPQQEWCKHCNPKKGCTIYEQRPTECSRFFCGYLLEDGIGDHWKPAKCKMVLAYEPHADRIVIHVDQTNPLVWRDEPYFSEIKAWATMAAENRGQVVVWQGKSVIVILPDDEQNLGAVNEDQLIIVGEVHTDQGIRLKAFTMERDDPRLKNQVLPKPPNSHR